MYIHVHDVYSYHVKHRYIHAQTRSAKGARMHVPNTGTGCTLSTCRFDRTGAIRKSLSQKAEEVWR